MESGLRERPEFHDDRELRTALLTAPLFANAQERAPGGVTIYDERNCPGNANSPKVTIPFSFGVTGLAPFSSAGSCL